jgi:hypothetical protein
MLGFGGGKGENTGLEVLSAGQNPAIEREKPN